MSKNYSQRELDRLIYQATMREKRRQMLRGAWFVIIPAFFLCIVPAIIFWIAWVASSVF